MAKPEKRPLDSTPDGWNNPFAGLSGAQLPAGEDACPPAGQPVVRAEFSGRVVLRKETAHRGGKAVIVVHDFPPQVTPSQIDDLARRLKKACGTGGTVKDRTIEIQGDQAGKIRALLEAAGFRVAGVR